MLLLTDRARGWAAALSDGLVMAGAVTRDARRAIPCSFLAGTEGREWACGGGRSWAVGHQDGLGVKIPLEGVVCSLSTLATHLSTAKPEFAVVVRIGIGGLRASSESGCGGGLGERTPASRASSAAAIRRDSPMASDALRHLGS